MSGKVLTINSNGMTQERPVSFATVAAAEAASFLSGEICSVLETRRFYQFDASSSETRDGIRVLTPAGGGRLLAIKTGSDDVEIPKIGTPDHQSLTQSLQVGLSAGACNGDFVTDAGSGAINIAAGEGMIRAVNSSDSAIFAFSWPEVNGVAIPLNSVRYVGVEYNSGSPQAVVRTTNNWNGQTEFQVATVVNEDGTLHILSNPQESCDGIQKIFHRLIDTQPFQFAERLGGGRFSEVGTRNLSLSPCEFYDGLNEFAITTKNTSTGDTFDSYYGSFTKVASQTQWDNQNFDNAGTLTALSANRYGVHWLYIDMDDSFALVYGKGNYNTISDAEAAFPPASLPLRLSLGSRLAAKLIFQQGAASAIQIESAFDAKFQSGMPVAHDDLTNVLGNGYYHLSESERDAAIRTATAAQSGLMSAAQAQSVANSVAGATSATDNAICRFDGATGKIIQNSSVTIEDDGSVDSNKQFKVTKGNRYAFFSENGILDNYPRAAFNIGTSVAPVNFGMWIRPDYNVDVSTFVEVITKNTIDANTKRLMLRQGTTTAEVLVSSGGGTAVGTPLSIYTYGNNAQLYLNTDGNTGLSKNTPTARLHVKGYGSTSTTKDLKIDNASDAESLSVRGDGLLNTSGSRIKGFNTFTADATLTQSSKSVAVFNPPGTGLVITMHLSPPDGYEQVTVNASAFAVTLGRNDQLMDGTAANYTLPANTSITWQFFGDTIGWLIISQG